MCLIMTRRNRRTCSCQSSGKAPIAVVRKPTAATGHFSVHHREVPTIALTLRRGLNDACTLSAARSIPSQSLSYATSPSGARMCPCSCCSSPSGSLGDGSPQVRALVKHRGFYDVPRAVVLLQLSRRLSPAHSFAGAVSMPPLLPTPQKDATASATSSARSCLIVA